MVLGITTACEYRQKTEEDLADFRREIDNSRFAINAVTSVFHLHEWLWSKKIKPSQTKQVVNPSTNQSTTVLDINAFRQWLDSNCPYFELVQELTNGSKHAYHVHSGGKVGGWGQAPYGTGPWGTTYLLIDLGPNTTDRYLVASDVINEAGKFMVALALKLDA